MLGRQAAKPATTKQVGDAAEDRALAYLQAQGLRLLTRHYRTPGRGGGEIDLVMREANGTVVFVEVRQRRSSGHGGAAASVTAIKQQRLVFAARHYLLRLNPVPPCRFDVVALEGDAANPTINWIQGAFTAD